MPFGLPRALEEWTRFVVVLLVVVRDAEHQLGTARVLELALVDAALDGRDSRRPILALHLHLAKPDERVAARGHLGRSRQRRNGLVELARGDPAIRELLVELVVER